MKVQAPVPTAPIGNAIPAVPEVPAAPPAPADTSSSDAKAAKAAEAAEKARIKAEKDAEKARIKAEKAAKKEEAKKAREAKAAAKAAAKVTMPMQNDVRQPRPGGLCAAVWDLATSLVDGDKIPTMSDVLEAARAKGLSEGNARTEYARWRKFHGHPAVGRAPKAPPAPAVPAPPAPAAPAV